MAVPELLTLEEFATEYRVPLYTARYWRQTGKGPKTFKRGRRVFVMRADADAWQRSCYEAEDGAAQGSRRASA